jgi:hypothetical protein
MLPECSWVYSEPVIYNEDEEPGISANESPKCVLNIRASTFEPSRNKPKLNIFQYDRKDMPSIVVELRNTEICFDDERRQGSDTHMNRMVCVYR